MIITLFLITLAVAHGMRSFGTAVKALQLSAGVEHEVFSHTLSPNASHGALTQQWHAGHDNLALRVRVYVDGEVTASIDYPVGLAHGAGPSQAALPPSGPWASALFGRTNDGGWWNTFLAPFGASVRVTLTNAAPLTVWYMVRGVEGWPLAVGAVPLPPTARLALTRTQATVPAGSLLTWAAVEGREGLLRQVNLVVNSSDYAYQEGCVSAAIDGGEGLWLSSGLEDYFLGAYFHGMPVLHQAYSGFALNATSEPERLPTNSVAAYRIHDQDPVLFSQNFTLRWIASSDNKDHNAGWCNYNWPAAPLPNSPPLPSPSLGNVTVDVLAWLYVW